MQQSYNPTTASWPSTFPMAAISLTDIKQVLNILKTHFTYHQFILFFEDTKKISSVSVFFETFPYRLNEDTGLIDYDKMEENAKLYRPKLIVAGASAYARLIDYQRIRKICDINGAYLLSDMAHISGCT